jgi:hypothetical protein
MPSSDSSAGAPPRTSAWWAIGFERSTAVRRSGHELIIREFQRFEGVSDRDDANPTASAFLHDVPIRRTVAPGAVGPA